MRLFLIAVATATAALAATVQPGSAARYCLMGDSGSTGGIPVCLYHTFEQCLASLSGGRDSCMENPAWIAKGYQQPRSKPVARPRVRDQRY